jgi:hypothetical protein
LPGKSRLTDVTEEQSQEDMESVFSTSPTKSEKKGHVRQTTVDLQNELHEAKRAATYEVHRMEKDM